MKIYVIILTLFCYIVNVSCQELSISYLGNMGVIIGNEKKSILIDGLHEFYKAAYLNPDTLTINQLTNGSYQEFGQPKIVIATHKHSDHFSANLVNDFLNKNPSSAFIGSPQLISSLQNRGQTIVVNYTDSIYNFMFDGISIHAFKIGHIGTSRHKAIENCAFIIELDGIKILHVGDTDWDVAEIYFNKYGSKIKNSDVAIIPYWMLLENDSIQKLTKYINPKLTIVTHIAPRQKMDEPDGLQSTRMQIKLFESMNQTIEFSKN